MQHAGKVNCKLHKFVLDHRHPQAVSRIGRFESLLPMTRAEVDPDVFSDNHHPMAAVSERLPYQYPGAWASPQAPAPGVAMHAA